MLLSSWIIESEHRAWERDFNVRAARGEFVRDSRSAPVRGRRIHLGGLLGRLRLAPQAPERLPRQV